MQDTPVWVWVWVCVRHDCARYAHGAEDPGERRLPGPDDPTMRKRQSDDMSRPIG